MSSIRNPLGYWCAPNGCTPEYMPSPSITDFLAYGLLVCCIDPKDTCCTFTDQDVNDLREGFLHCVEDAVKVWSEQEIGQDTGCDPAKPTVTLECPDGESCEAGWYFQRVDEDALLFVLFWTGADDLAIWLSRRAIEGKESEALAAINHARQMIGQRASTQN